MPSLRSVLTLALICLQVHDGQALSFRMRKHKAQPSTPSTPRRFSRFMGRQVDLAPLELDNLYDLYYSTFLTIDGQELEVQLDTGSGELWVRPEDPWSTSVVQYSTIVPIRYGIGSFNGTLTKATVSLGDVAIPNQAFLTYKNGDISNVFQAGLDGMLGLGFDEGSSVLRTMRASTSDDSGRTLLSNFFLSNPSVPRTISFFMGRNNDPNVDDDDGLFMVGEPEPEYQAVTTAPAIPVHVNSHSTDFQRWSTYVDAIEVNGVNITGVQSVVAGAPAAKTVANIDTGTSLAWVPKSVADAIYGGIQGAQYFEDSGQYTVPCLSAPRIALWFNGQRIPIHPLDATRVTTRTGASGEREYVCSNTFLHTTALASQSSTLDMQLGDSFLRNIIAQYDFGTPGDYSTANIRMVATTTDELAALNAFNAVRSAQVGLAAPPVVTELPGAPSTTTTTSQPSGSTATVDPTLTPDAPPGVPPTIPDDESTTDTSTDTNNDTAPEENADDGARSIAVPTTVLILLSSLLISAL